MKNKGISLIMLVITIIVILILAAAVILTLFNTSIPEKAIKARFMSDFRTVQEAVNIYSAANYNTETTKFGLPIKGYLTSSNKADIKNNVPTLKNKIEELSGKIDSVNLAWIDADKINATLSPKKQDKGYIIDVDSAQIYDYSGDFFEGLRWHTLDGGVEELGQNGAKSQEVWNGWMTLTLYYPAGATNKQWRLGSEGEVRLDPMLIWQDYTGPITVPLDRVHDVWIKYSLNGKSVTIPPAGTLLVDIIPDSNGTTKVDKVNVTINYDENATTKEYRIGNSGWFTYQGPFVVTENCVVEARASKTEYIYNTDGSLLSTRNITDSDMVYIGNIGTATNEPGGGAAGSGSSTLVAPTITRIAPVNPDEKARVQITYPIGANKKVYKINYGLEENYADVVSITQWGTYVAAYYYDASGTKSLSTSIYINDTTGGTIPESPKPYTPESPKLPGDPPPSPPVAPPGTPTLALTAPVINVSPTSLANQVTISLTTPLNAGKTYIKLGKYSDYVEYISSVVVKENMEIYAYYEIYTGEKSPVAHRVVSNIKKSNLPYVYIDANPYPWSGSYGAKDVTVTVNYSDANTIEYSEDGIIYKPYTAPFTVTENKTIYARGINSYGVTETSLNITNIGQLLPPPQIMQNLYVNITANPEPILSTNQVAKVGITIDYDAKATEKYYSIGKYGTLNEYTGPFDITSNATIYAYAKSTNGQGETSKTIDNLINGIANPVITSNPDNNKQASKDKISITYDKYATVKRYSIDGGSLRDYGGEFDVTTNGSVILAYSENAKGQKSQSTYTINNIVPQPPILTLDKGMYYLLKLNYPDTATTKEYKWKINGTWMPYKDAGILLIKPEYKDQLIQNGTLIKIEDESGNMVTFTGDYYLIDVPINELSENIFMRWDRTPLGAPQILIDPSTASKQVTVSIAYNSSLVKKQYRIIAPDGTIGDWKDYISPFTVDRNNITIVANGMDETEVWTSDSMVKITNIDEIAPVIKLTADLNTAQQKVAVKVSVTDDVAVGKVKWAAGVQGESYFLSNGTEILNDSVVNITNNGYYTFYAEDKVGNTQVYTLNVTNVDLTPPAIDITVSPETTVSLSTNVTINYGDAVTKQYKVGTSNATWTNYTTTFAVSSYTVLANNWQNSDGTVTVYAKGKDSSGNEIIVQKKIVSLDLDSPKTPIINANSGYPTLAEYGIKFGSSATITFDTRTDIDNYYSIDSGTTWLPYTGPFNIVSGTIIAKSVKKSTGLQVSVSKTITMPTDALAVQAYDGNDNTAISISSYSGYILVDSSMIGKNVRAKYYTGGSNVYIRFLNSSKTEISNVTKGPWATFDEVYNIPANTAWIKIENSNAGNYAGAFYEIQSSNEPTFSSTSGYMLLHADPTKSIKEPYQMVTINYFQTSVQRLYRIGTSGDWLNYNDIPIKVTQGQTIYAKGIDQYGNPTRLTTSLTASVPDAMPKETFDNNDNTAISISSYSGYMQVDSSMIGKSVRAKYYSGGSNVYIRFLNSSKAEISNITKGAWTTFDEVYNIPANTAWIKVENSNAGNYPGAFYEIQSSNEPTFSSTNGYMLLHADPTKAIKEPYQMVTINYFPTSVQKLYRIGTSGDWLSYNNSPVKVNQGQTIYAKGIDQYGNPTRIISSLTANVPDALPKETFDNNDGTSIVGNSNSGIIEIDPSMVGLKVRIKSNTAGQNMYIRFLNSSKTEISNIMKGAWGSFDETYLIPANTKYMKIEFTYSNPYSGALSEIQPANEPTFTTSNGYAVINYDDSKSIKEPYQMVTVTYFPTSVQRLYSIGTSGVWLNYNNTPVKVNQGQTLYAKGIDQYGNVTRLTTSITASVPDALPKEGFDNNYGTYVSMSGIFNYIQVDSSMWGKKVWVRANTNGTGMYIRFLQSNMQEISNVYRGGWSVVDEAMAVPTNTKYIKIEFSYGGNYPGYFYDIKPSP